MPSKKAKRKARQQRLQAASRLRQQERPRLYWLKRKAKNVHWRVRQGLRVGWRYLRPTGRTFAGVVVVIATVLGLYEVLLPRLSVSQIVPLDPSNPFSVPIAVKNSGYFSLYDVQASCAVNRALTADEIDMAQTDLVPSVNKLFDEITPDESATFHCPLPRLVTYKSPLIYADIELVIEYRAEYLFWRNVKRFRFVTARASDGTLRWVEQPSIKK